MTSTDDEIVRVVQVGVVISLIALISPPHHIHIPDVQESWMDRNMQSRNKDAIKTSLKILRDNKQENIDVAKQFFVVNFFSILPLTSDFLVHLKKKKFVLQGNRTQQGKQKLK